MNKRNLALLISKHPLMRKLTEDKTIPKSIVARLIVEELMEAERQTISNKLGKLLAQGKKEERESIIVNFFKVLKSGQGYEKLFPTWQNMPEEKKQAFIEAGMKFDITKGRAKEFTRQIIAATTPQEVEANAEELVGDVEAQTGIDLDNIQSAAGKEIVLTDEHKSIQRQLKAVLGALANKPFYLKRSDGSYSEVVDIMFWPTSAVPLLKDKEYPQYNAPGLDKEIVSQQGVSKMSNEKPLWNDVYKAKSHSWVFFMDPEKIQERLGTSNAYKVFNDVTLGQLIKAKILLSVEKFEKLKDPTELARQELDIEPIVKKFGQYEYFKPLDDEQKKVMFKFIALLKRNELFENLDGKTSMVKVLRDLGVKGVPKMEVILQYMTEQEQQAVQDILSNQKTSVDKFLAMLKKAELAAVDKEPGKEEKPSTPMKGEPVAIDPEQAGAFVGAANELLNDFYNQKYRKAQADIVDKVIKSMKAFVEDADLALAFGKPPADKPEEQEATSEEPPKEQEEPAPLEEQEEQEVKADKDEMRNIRIGLRSFLSRVNKTNKYLTEFEKVAGAGSVLSDAYKKKFMDNLKEIQTAIYRLALVLNKMLDSKEELNEKKGSETMNKWREVQKLYDLSIKSVSSVKELLDTETPPDELDSTLTNDAYTALIDLAGHFPSVAPFGAGKMKRSDFEEYKTKFANAIGQVKSDLQNVFNLIKTGEAGEESLQNARDGLRDFGDQIASIFGVPSRFKDAKVKPGDDKSPAVQEDPEAEDTSDFPKDLPTQIKDLLDEYVVKYKKAKQALQVFDKKLKESIEDEFRDIKSAIKKADKFTDIVTKNYVPMMRAGTKAGRKPEESKKMLIDQIRYFVEVYEELQGLYKRANQEPEEAKKPSWWKNLWPKTLEKFNKLKDIMKELYSKFEDWIVGQGLDIDLDLNPSDFQIRDISKPEDQGKERPGEAEVEEEFQFSNIKDIRTQLTSKKADIKIIKKLLAKADGIDGNEELVNKYYEAFLLWYLMLNEKEAALQEDWYQKIPIETRKETTKEKYNKAMQKLKTSNEEYFNTIKDFHQSLPPTIVQKFYKTFETIFEDEEINIAIDKTFINTFSKRLNLTKKTEPGEEETDDSLLDGDDLLQEQIANKLKPLIKEMLNKGNKK